MTATSVYRETYIHNSGEERGRKLLTWSFLDLFWRAHFGELLLPTLAIDLKSVILDIQAADWDYIIHEFSGIHT